MTRFRFFKRCHEFSYSGVTLKPVRDKGLQIFSQKFHPQDFLEQGLFQVFLFYDIENLSPHSIPPEVSFVTDDYYSFLISAILDKLCHVLTQNRSTFH